MPSFVQETTHSGAILIQLDKYMIQVALLHADNACWNLRVY